MPKTNCLHRMDNAPFFLSLGFGDADTFGASGAADVFDFSDLNSALDRQCQDEAGQGQPAKHSHTQGVGQQHAQHAQHGAQHAQHVGCCRPAAEAVAGLLLPEFYVVSEEEPQGGQMPAFSVFLGCKAELSV